MNGLVKFQPQEQEIWEWAVSRIWRLVSENAGVCNDVTTPPRYNQGSIIQSSGTAMPLTLKCSDPADPGEGACREALAHEVPG